MSTPNSTLWTEAKAGPPRPGRSPQPAWLERLWAQERVPLGQEKLYWWGVNVQSFLAFVRRHQLDGPLDALVAGFLADLRVSQPPVPEWRQTQARQALEVFARGIEHWHWERDEGGQLRPAFRVESGSEGAVEPGGGPMAGSAAGIRPGGAERCSGPLQASP